MRVVCCWCVVSLNLDGVKPGQKTFQIPGGLLDLYGQLGSRFFYTFQIPQFTSFGNVPWTSSPNSDSVEVTCSQILLVPSDLYWREARAFPLAGGFYLESEFTGLGQDILVFWDGRDFGEIQIQPIHFPDMYPEFQGGERNNSRSHSEPVSGWARA